MMGPNSSGKRSEVLMRDFRRRFSEQCFQSTGSGGVVAAVEIVTDWISVGKSSLSSLDASHEFCKIEYL